ncbi:uncharacterized protein LOC135470761 [Liolophura sinensis]|uniref:uncharacterized protein LOC135470761 n=1 Tax=Liolophura sinensis TaxID=3198878 RepID=UPI003157FF5A
MTEAFTSNQLMEILTRMPDPRQTKFSDLWDGFISKIFSSIRDVSAAGIFHLESGTLLVKTPAFNAQAGELEDIVDRFDDLDGLYGEGVTINGENFKVRLADGRFGILARTGFRGCSVCKTFSLLIVGVHDERGKGAKCNELVMRIGDYFFRKGL